MGLRTIHRFAGAGGGIWADLLLGHTPTCAVEIDPYCQHVLIQRQHDGDFPPFPVWDDVCTFGRAVWPEDVDVIHAGFPCQPWSVAGNRKGQGDSRNLWPDTLRVVCELRPRYVFLENVPTLITHPYFRNAILGGLAESGYDAVWAVLGADDVGAPHRRKRLWLLATDADQLHDNLGRHGTSTVCWQRSETAELSRCQETANADSGGSKKQRRPRPTTTKNFSYRCGDWWDNFPYLGGMVDGLANRSHRVRVLGNGQVPLCAAVAWCMLMPMLQGLGVALPDSTKEEDYVISD